MKSGWRLDQGSIPLLPMQEAILFDCDLLGGHAVYTVEVPVWLKGSVDPERVNASFRAAVARHDAFRLRILPNGVGDAGLWAQSLWDDAELVRTLGQSKSHRLPIDPEAGPPLEIRTMSMDATGAKFLIRFHHVAADRASIDLLLEDFVALYIGDTPGTCGDYNASVRTLLSSYGVGVAAEPSITDRSLRLAVPPTCSDPASPSGRTVRRQSLSFDGHAWKTLRMRAREAGVTAHSLTLAAYAMILARLGYSDNITVGIPVSQRETLAEPRTAGCLMTVLPLAICVRPNEDLIKLAMSVGVSMIDLYQRRWSRLLSVARSGPETTSADRTPPLPDGIRLGRAVSDRAVRASCRERDAPTISIAP